MNKKRDEVIEYLNNLTKDDLLTIIKYGLRDSNAPTGITVEDIYTAIGCSFCGELKWL